MAKRKPTNKYYFSVEGETEQWYLKWLQDTINNNEKAACKVSIDCPVRKNPLKHAKSLTVTRKIEIYHFFDYESDEPLHVRGFQEALDNMKKAEKNNILLLLIKHLEKNLQTWMNSKKRIILKDV